MAHPSAHPFPSQDWKLWSPAPSYPATPVCDLRHSGRRRETRRTAGSAGRLDLTLTRPQHPGLKFSWAGFILSFDKTMSETHSEPGAGDTAAGQPDPCDSHGGSRSKGEPRPHIRNQAPRRAGFHQGDRRGHTSVLGLCICKHHPEKANNKKSNNSSQQQS